MGTFSGNAFDSGTFDVYVPLGWDVDTTPRQGRCRPRTDSSSDLILSAREFSTVDEFQAPPRRDDRRSGRESESVTCLLHLLPELEDRLAPRRLTRRQSPPDDVVVGAFSKSLAVGLEDYPILCRCLRQIPSLDNLSVGAVSLTAPPELTEAPSLRRLAKRQPSRDDAFSSAVSWTASPSLAEASSLRWFAKRQPTRDEAFSSRGLWTVPQDLAGAPFIRWIAKKPPSPDDVVVSPTTPALLPHLEDVSLRPRTAKGLPSADDTFGGSTRLTALPDLEPSALPARRRFAAAIATDLPRPIVIPQGVIAEPRPAERPRSRSRADSLAEPLQRLRTPVIPDGERVRSWRSRALSGEQQVARPSPSYSPQGDTSTLARRRRRLFVPEDVSVRTSLPPAAAPWGFEQVSTPKRERPLTAEFDFAVLVPPVGPSPIPNLPINVFIGGGGGAPRVEIDDRSLVDDLDDYYDELVARSSSLRGVVPDVLGREEYESERRQRRAEPNLVELPRPTTCKFEPSLKPESYLRLMRLVSDARSRGLSVVETDAFTLRYRLHKFSTDLELKMVGGCMVKLTTLRQNDLVALAKLAHLHLYQLVTWTRDSIFVFDNTTLTSKRPPVFWWALGAGCGLALGAVLWRRPQVAEAPRTKAKKRTKKSHRRRR